MPHQRNHHPFKIADRGPHVQRSAERQEASANGELVMEAGQTQTDRHTERAQRLPSGKPERQISKKNKQKRQNKKGNKTKKPKNQNKQKSPTPIKQTNRKQKNQQDGVWTAGGSGLSRF